MNHREIKKEKLNLTRRLGANKKEKIRIDFEIRSLRRKCATFQVKNGTLSGQHWENHSCSNCDPTFHT